MQALVAAASSRRGRRVDLLEVGDHGLHRRAQAVEVEAVEAHASPRSREAFVVGAQPPDEVQDLGVAPHPGGESAEAAQGLLGVAVLAGALHVAADAVGVGPVALDGHSREPELLDQPPRDARALAVELVRPVAGLAEQHEPRVAHQLEQRVIVALAAVEGTRIEPQRLERRAFTDGQGQRRGHGSSGPRQRRVALCDAR